METHAPEPCPDSIPGAGWLEKLEGRRIFIETYGCRYNFGDTAKLVEVLKDCGCSLVDSAGEADAVIINTCTVVGPTERRMLRRLAKFQDHDLYVTGCMAAVQRAAIFAVCNPTIIPTADIHKAYRNAETIAPGSVGIVQIAQGCAGRCTYCITRLARGPLKSFSAEMILGQITAYAEAGASEIQITAQDVSAWGLDCGLSLDELLGGIKKIPGQFMVRVGMMNPATAKRNTDDLIEAFSDDRIFKFVHLPVQSGSDKILEKMGRGYIVAEFEDIVFRFRRRFPGITIATDLIVGFPDETETDFMMSLDLIERVRPNKVNITRYSPRPFTGLLAGKDHPDSVKKDRSRRANHHAERMYTILNKPYLGKEVPFLVTEKIRKGSVMARTPAYLGIVIYEDLPAGFEGRAILEKDHRYFFTGRRVE